MLVALKTNTVLCENCRTPYSASLKLFICVFIEACSCFSFPLTFHHGGHQPSIDLSATADRSMDGSASGNGTDAAEIAINYVLLTNNRNAWNWKENEHSSLWRRVWRDKGQRELRGVFGRESHAVVNIISVACRQSLLFAPICLLLLLLKAFWATQTHHPSKPETF